MKKISKQRILREKESGKYSCPHFISPNTANEIANSINLELDNEAAKTLAEIAENFAEEVLITLGNEAPTKENIRNILSTILLY